MKRNNKKKKRYINSLTGLLAAVIVISLTAVLMTGCGGTAGGRSTEAAQEATPEASSESAAETASGSSAEKTAETASGSAAEETTETASGSSAEETAEIASGSVAEETAETASGSAAEETAETASGSAAEKTTKTESGSSAEEKSETASETSAEETEKSASGSAKEAAGKKEKNEKKEPEILHFVDAHGNWYDAEINPDIEKNPYDPAAFFNDGNICSYQDENYTSRRGIDVSAYQGDIDWRAVADSGIEFVFIRIGFRGYGQEGTLVPDSNFPDNIKGAQDAGLDTGIYFFSQAVNEAEAVEEAELCLELLGSYDLQLPVVFDAENILNDDARTDNVSGEQFTKNAIAFCERIKGDDRYSAAIYSNMKWEAFTYDLSKLSDYPVWYADYEQLPQTPYMFRYWQYSDLGTVDGISVPVDLDIEIMPN